MIATASTPAAAGSTARRDQVSLPRLVWVAPLTLALAVAACFVIRFVAQRIDPRTVNMPMLREPMVVLAVEGALAAIAVFVVFAVFVPRPIFWYRIVGGLALLVSLLPDLGLALGGAPMLTAMRLAGSLIGDIGGPAGPGGPGAGGPPPGAGPGGGGPPPGFLSGMSLDQVLVLMALHVAVGLVCIGLLTTLARKHSPAVASA